MWFCFVRVDQQPLCLFSWVHLAFKSKTIKILVFHLVSFGKESMKNSARTSIYDLLSYFKVSSVVYLLIVTNFLAYTESCPLKCTCTPERSIYNAYDLRLTSPLVRETTTDFPTAGASMTQNTSLQNVSVMCQRVGLQEIPEKKNLNGLNPKAVIRL